MKLIKWQFNRTILPLLKNPKFIWGSSLVLGGIVYFKVWLPLTNIGIPCPFYKITGHYCPGCGITRAISALFAGDLSRAWHNNLLLFIIPIIFITYFFLQKRRYPKLAEAVLYITIVFVLIYGILRNFPAFYYLAPIPIK